MYILYYILRLLKNVFFWQPDKSRWSKQRQQSIWVSKPQNITQQISKLVDFSSNNRKVIDTSKPKECRYNMRLVV